MLDILTRITPMWSSFRVLGRKWYGLQTQGVEVSARSSTLVMCLKSMHTSAHGLGKEALVWRFVFDWLSWRPLLIVASELCFVRFFVNPRTDELQMGAAGGIVLAMRTLQQQKELDDGTVVVIFGMRKRAVWA